MHGKKFYRKRKNFIDAAEWNKEFAWLHKIDGI